MARAMLRFDPFRSGGLIAELIMLCALTFVITGCATEGISPGSTPPVLTPAISPTEQSTQPRPIQSPQGSTANQLTAEQLCAEAFPNGTVLAWAADTVSGFRSYHYGGPQPTYPLADAFTGRPDSTAGAWCGTKQASDTIRWWAVIPGSDPVQAIDVTGPGSTEPRGDVSSPPWVP